MKKSQLIFILSAMALAALSRLLPHPPNFTAVGAMALFAGAVLERKSLALLVPLLAYWFSDLILNNAVYGAYYDGFVWFSSNLLWVTMALVGSIFLGRLLKKQVNFINISAVSLSSATVFYLVTNFGVWTSGQMYPMTFEGLLSCYIAGIPFYGNQLASTLLYTGVVFTLYHYVRQKQPIQSV
ncbi:DUF6580 family putative transport protein [Algicola sagamiensis]|uniref:DUF6580 family putative transport protein n=1 Tax=Algicola sagamiensis TaxID=163869 RepID=UPI00037329D6|nr:DUF6580 family putative transport protein [Algicola sagamiensis]